MSILVLILFTLAWAGVILLVVRALVIVLRQDRRVAMATAVAVAGAFVVGALSPFSLWMRPAPQAAAVAVAVAVPPPKVVTCPATAKVAGGNAQGHIDAASVGGAGVPVVSLTRVGRGQAVGLGGWIVASGATLANGVCVVVDGHPVPAKAIYGLDRPDVAAALAKPDDRTAGFDLTFTLPPGSHTVVIGAVEADGRTVHVLDTPLHIVSQ